jgi:hypothetical protein
MYIYHLLGMMGRNRHSTHKSPADVPRFLSFQQTWEKLMPRYKDLCLVFHRLLQSGRSALFHYLHMMRRQVGISDFLHMVRSDQYLPPINRLDLLRAHQMYMDDIHGTRLSCTVAEPLHLQQHILLQYLFLHGRMMQ